MTGMSPPVDDAPRDAPERSQATDGRALDIDRAKGFGIALVVWGHIANASTLAAPLWFYISVGTIYAFHMPFFMYLSGFVFFMIDAPERFWKSPARVVAKRFDRLIVPFVAFGVVAVIGKDLLASVGPVGNGVDGIGDGILQVLTNAPGNPSLSLWYILVLFVYSVLTPLVWRLGRRSFLPLIALGLVGWIIPIPEDFYLRRIAVFYIFFVVGGIFAVHRTAILPLLRRWYLPLLLAFAVICFFTLNMAYTLLICGLACLPGLHGLFLQRYWDGDRVLLTLGRYSMAIYLLNTIALGAAKIVYLRFLPYEGNWFPLFVTLMFVIGLVGPMIASIVIGRLPVVRRLKRYLD